jgi:[protein-PII] uridylyltransferase
VALSLERREDLYCLTVITRDRPFLLASLAGALSGFGMNVLKAEAFSNRQAMVLDTFVFEDPNRTLELNPSEKERFHRLVARAALGQLRPGDLPAHRGGQPHRRGRAISPSVTFDSETSSSATLLEVVAEDRPGLLYDLATVISSHGCNIELVLLDTQARKALDVFYITKDGRKLEPDLEAALREQLLEVCRG